MALAYDNNDQEAYILMIYDDDTADGTFFAVSVSFYILFLVVGFVQCLTTFNDHVIRLDNSGQVHGCPSHPHSRLVLHATITS